MFEVQPGKKMCIKGSPSKGGDIYVINIQSIQGSVEGMILLLFLKFLPFP
jgi:hypothetical protein